MPIHNSVISLYTFRNRETAPRAKLHAEEATVDVARKDIWRLMGLQVNLNLRNGVF